MPDRTALVVTALGLVLATCPQTARAEDQLLVSDSLDGATVGQQDGPGQFVAGGGWRSQGGRIVFDAGRALTSGAFQCKMRGFTAPAQGADKSHPLTGWEVEDEYGHYEQTGSFFNWRIGRGYHPFKVLAAPQSIDTRQEARVGDEARVNQPGDHLYRIEWGEGRVRFLFDGDVLHEFAFGRFAIRWLVIGCDRQYPITDPAPILSDVEIFGTENDPGPDPDPHPDPDPDDGALQLAPEADTYVDARSPAAAFGGQQNLAVGGPPGERVAYLRYDLRSLPADAWITRAWLDLHATNSGYGGELRLLEASPTEWAEGNPTWAAPVGGEEHDEVLGSPGWVDSGDDYSVVLLADELGPDPVTFTLRSAEENGAAFASREVGGAQRPLLSIRWEPGAPDLGPPDLGPVDAGTPDLGEPDSGGGERDAGSPDSGAGPGEEDAGAANDLGGASPADAGDHPVEVDSGPTSPGGAVAQTDDPGAGGAGDEIAGEGGCAVASGEAPTSRAGLLVTLLLLGHLCRRGRRRR